MKLYQKSWWKGGRDRTMNLCLEHKLWKKCFSGTKPCFYYFNAEMWPMIQKTLHSWADLACRHCNFFEGIILFHCMYSKDLVTWTYLCDWTYFQVILFDIMSWLIMRWLGSTSQAILIGSFSRFQEKIKRDIGPSWYIHHNFGQRWYEWMCSTL